MILIISDSSYKKRVPPLRTNFVYLKGTFFGHTKFRAQKKNFLVGINFWESRILFCAKSFLHTVLIFAQLLLRVSLVLNFAYFENFLREYSKISTRENVYL